LLGLRPVDKRTEIRHLVLSNEYKHLQTENNLWLRCECVLQHCLCDHTRGVGYTSSLVYFRYRKHISASWWGTWMGWCGTLLALRFDF